MKILLTLLCLVTLAFTAAAADISGKWRAEFNTPDGTARTNTFAFKADGEKLTGTVTGSQDETPIKDGKVSGDSVSFTADRPFGTFKYTGKISGDEIKFNVTSLRDTCGIVRWFALDRIPMTGRSFAWIDEVKLSRATLVRRLARSGRNGQASTKG